MSDRTKETVWARYCYKSPVSKWEDGYARGHWMPAEQAEKAVALWRSKGQDVKVEYQ